MILLLDIALEFQVDLLGDEVDTLLSLLEKIYIALDHYSHILRHYPGVRLSPLLHNFNFLLENLKSQSEHYLSNHKI